MRTAEKPPMMGLYVGAALVLLLAYNAVYGKLADAALRNEPTPVVLRGAEDPIGEIIDRIERERPRPDLTAELDACRDDPQCIEIAMLQAGYKWTKKGWQL